MTWKIGDLGIIERLCACQMQDDEPHPLLYRTLTVAGVEEDVHRDCPVCEAELPRGQWIVTGMKVDDSKQFHTLPGAFVRRLGDQPTPSKIVIVKDVSYQDHLIASILQAKWPPGGSK